MTRYIKIESCQNCFYLQIGIAFSDITYKPKCGKADKTIPYPVTEDEYI